MTGFGTSPRSKSGTANLSTVAGYILKNPFCLLEVEEVVLSLMTYTQEDLLWLADAVEVREAPHGC
jgi:hypothetical protein